QSDVGSNAGALFCYRLFRNLNQYFLTFVEEIANRGRAACTLGSSRRTKILPTNIRSPLIWSTLIRPALLRSRALRSRRTATLVTGARFTRSDICGSHISDFGDFRSRFFDVACSL